VHLQEPIEITALPQALGVAEDCLNFSFAAPISKVVRSGCCS